MLEAASIRDRVDVAPDSVTTRRLSDGRAGTPQTTEEATPRTSKGVAGKAGLHPLEVSMQRRHDACVAAEVKVGAQGIVGMAGPSRDANAANIVARGGEAEGGSLLTATGEPSHDKTSDIAESTGSADQYEARLSDKRTIAEGGCWEGLANEGGEVPTPSVTEVPSQGRGRDSIDVTIAKALTMHTSVRVEGDVAQTRDVCGEGQSNNMGLIANVIPGQHQRIRANSHEAL